MVNVVVKKPRELEGTWLLRTRVAGAGAELVRGAVESAGMGAPGGAGLRLTVSRILHQGPQGRAAVRCRRFHACQGLSLLLPPQNTMNFLLALVFINFLLALIWRSYYGTCTSQPLFRSLNFNRTLTYKVNYTYTEIPEVLHIRP